MGRTYDHIPDNIIQWVKKQEVFWVATAPLSGEGHVNLSPKGLRGTFHVEGPNEVWYEDLTGSGSETIAHLLENGRITILFNAFEGPAEIVRLFGKGVAYEFGTDEYDARIPPSKRMPGSRAAIVVKVDRVGTSCGFGVPIYKFDGHRTTLLEFSQVLEKAKPGTMLSEDVDDPEKPDAENKMRKWWQRFNRFSIDGLPSMQIAPDSTSAINGVMPDPSEAAFHIKPPKENADKESPASVTLEPTLLQRNFKLIYGMVLGFGASFILSDILAASKRALSI